MAGGEYKIIYYKIEFGIYAKVGEKGHLKINTIFKTVILRDYFIFGFSITTDSFC